ncbi:hypothetical protein QBC37DRAFT_453547 [Rhypophila decipiens]|uniref:NACHT domain-containing protein n=1 Tax=Rhypophila decipiens TaxID=261697 RepID=A0AAN7BAN2_9PEZI|nr:hypothetical protein QBC37DRAFT_453547 [Rhypophila decipiens]
MDPLSALSIAAAAVQFIDFAQQRCRDVRKLYDLGDESLLHASRAIDELVDRCTDLARQLADIFKSLDSISKKGCRISKAFSYLRAEWSYIDITQITERLEKYQSQLALRMLLYLNLKAEAAENRETQRFNALESRIVEVLAVSENKLNLTQSQNEGPRRGVDQNNALQTMPDETFAAILTLENGKTSVLSSDGPGQCHVVEKGRQKYMTLGSGADKMTTRIGDFKPIQDKVLACLYFRRLGDRYDDVSWAHDKIYGWILEGAPLRMDTQPLPGSETHFLQWLKTDSGCFWINGKAGSGKSTLMKFIWEHPNTRIALWGWAQSGSRDLAMGSYFFWNLGSSLQKSMEGLLRSLLYKILQDRPHLISVIMPELWMAGVTHDRREALASPSYSELLRWFRRLLDRATSQLRLVFLIDGLDEYDGEYHEICKLIKSYSNYDHVKFIVSSRPVPICVDHFSSSPHLRLQDLTQADIRRYAQDHLKDRLYERFGEQSHVLIEQIVERSCGVFLWVVLVVRSISQGIANWDNFKELSQRLDDLPTDLEELYAHMLRSMPLPYRTQASRLLQITLRVVEAQQPVRLTPLQLHFAQQEDRTVLGTPNVPLSVQEIANICAEVEGRIRSRCCGLLEVRIADTSKKRQLLHQHQYVDFIHRTVVEFLRLADVWSDLASLTEDDSAFHPDINLFRSCVLVCKTMATEPTIAPVMRSSVWEYMQLAFGYAAQAEESDNPINSSILDELDKAVAYHWRAASKRQGPLGIIDTKDLHWANGFSLVPNTSPGFSDLGTIVTSGAKPIFFQIVAEYLGLVTYFRDMPAEVQANQHRHGEQHGQATVTLFNGIKLILQWKPWPFKRLETMVRRTASICAILLAKGANPNAELCATSEASMTSWNLMLRYSAWNAQHIKADFQKCLLAGSGFPPMFYQLLTAFVKAGADVNIPVLWADKLNRNVSQPDATAGPLRVSVRYSALKVLESLFSVPESDARDYDFILGRDNETNTTANMESFHKPLMQLMIGRGAVARVWEDGKLVSGPSLQVAVVKGSMSTNGRRR